MKTKIIYISGNEIFDINDIRSAFNDVRNALNLANDTVLFGVPIDEDDIGLGTNTNDTTETKIANIQYDEPTMPVSEGIVEIETKTTQIIDETPVVENDVETAETTTEKTKKTRGRPRKNKKEENEEPTVPEQTSDSEPDENKVIPILSVLSAKKEKTEPKEEEVIEESADDESEEESDDEYIDDESETVDITDETDDETVDDESEEYETSDDEESEEIVDEESDDEDSTMEISGEIFDAEIPDLNDATENQSDSDQDIEKLLSKMPSLNEDSTTGDAETPEPEETEPEEDVDETLAKLATEFAEAQDSISSKRKNTNGGFIGKLRGRLPFHPKTKDQGITDLFNWGGLAANDEDFPVPGFFTKTKDKK